jgi:fucose permease
MEIPNEFFTVESLLTLAGATLISTVVTNSIQYVFSWNPKWFGLVIAMIIAIVGVILTSDSKPLDFFIGLINGFFIYANSTGIMQMAGNPRSITAGKAAKQKRGFMDKWY